MKYYAVTDDPRELYHYGVKGMKWGQHIFGDKPKSPGYHRALGKLRSIRNSTQKSSVKKSKQERNYEKAVKAANKRINLIDNLNRYDQEKALDKQYFKEIKMAKKAEKYSTKKAAAAQRNDLKELKKSAKAEGKMDKYMQEAREGRLRYGKLSPDQIGAVQDRLQMEANARRLGGAEKPSWSQQKKEARRAGKLKGIEAGTAAVMQEVARAGAQWGLQGIRNNMILKNAAKQEGKRQKIKNVEANKKTRKDFKRDLEQDLAKAEVYDTTGITKSMKYRYATNAESLRMLQNAQEQQKINDDRNRAIDERYSKYLEDRGITDKQYRSEYSKLLGEQYGNFSSQKMKFDSMSEEEQRRYLQRFEDKKNAGKEDAIKRENEQYRIDLEQYKDDLTRYNKERTEYDKIERDYVTKFNEWLRNGANGKPPLKPYMPEPKKPIPPKIPQHLLPGGNNGGGGKKK